MKGGVNINRLSNAGRQASNLLGIRNVSNVSGRPIVSIIIIIVIFIVATGVFYFITYFSDIKDLSDKGKDEISKSDRVKNIKVSYNDDNDNN